MICECKHCRKSFNNITFSTTCPACAEYDEELFERIKDYLAHFPNSNAINLAEALGIKASLVLKYVDEGKLVAVNGRFEKL